MSSVSVDCSVGGDGWTCRVVVSERGSQTEHEVTVGRDELERLAPGAGEPTALVEASFAYLLEREPKESILRRFAISEIERYFPGYPSEIGGRLNKP
ncbi:MAG: hypothetical protein M3253_08275 [Chloroflexota bacterium]|nr:hypothetical protein [Chloroflexota bacterium]